MAHVDALSRVHDGEQNDASSVETDLSKRLDVFVALSLTPDQPSKLQRKYRERPLQKIFRELGDEDEESDVDDQPERERSTTRDAQLEEEQPEADESPVQETCFCKHVSSADVFENTYNEFLLHVTNLPFPCTDHKHEIMTEISLCIF
ncbi:hypothetical protein QTP88_022069 [Uroleucon formosanum]